MGTVGEEAVCRSAPPLPRFGSHHDHVEPSGPPSSSPRLGLPARAPRPPPGRWCHRRRGPRRRACQLSQADPPPLPGHVPGLPSAGQGARGVRDDRGRADARPGRFRDGGDRSLQAGGEPAARGDHGRSRWRLRDAEAGKAAVSRRGGAGAPLDQRRRPGRHPSLRRAARRCRASSRLFAPAGDHLARLLPRWPAPRRVGLP